MVPEVATGLLSRKRRQGFFPLPGTDVPWSPEWQEIFQRAIAALQPGLEQSYELQARHLGAQILVCDRGLMDGAAYTPGGVPEFCRIHSLAAEDVYARYAVIVHLESTATGDPDHFLADVTRGNAARIEVAFDEVLERSQATELATREAWRNHPNWHFIPCTEGGIAEKVAVLKTIVRQFL